MGLAILLFSRLYYRSPLKRQSWSPSELERVLLVYYQLRQTSPFSEMPLQSQLPHGGSVADLRPGADCSPVLHCHRNSHGCTVLSNILPSAENVLFFERHFPDLPWTVEDLPCFSEVRSFTSWYALLLLFLFRQISISSHWAHIQSSFAFFTAFRILFLVSLYSFAPSASYRSFYKFFLSSRRSRTCLVTHGFILRRSFPSIRHCFIHIDVVGGNHGIDVHVLISQSNEWLLKNASHIWVPQLLKIKP